MHGRCGAAAVSVDGKTLPSIQWGPGSVGGGGPKAVLPTVHGLPRGGGGGRSESREPRQSSTLSPSRRDGLRDRDREWGRGDSRERARDERGRSRLDSRPPSGDSRDRGREYERERERARDGFVRGDGRSPLSPPRGRDLGRDRGGDERGGRDRGWEGPGGRRGDQGDPHAALERRERQHESEAMVDTEAGGGGGRGGGGGGGERRLKRTGGMRRASGIGGMAGAAVKAATAFLPSASGGLAERQV